MNTITVIRALDGSSFVKCPACSMSIAATLISGHNCRDGIQLELKALVHPVEILAPAKKGLKKKRAASTGGDDKSQKKPKPDTKGKSQSVASPSKSDVSLRQKKKYMLDGVEVKRNKNAYMLYANAQRAAVTAELTKGRDGSVSLQEVSKVMGAQWKGLVAADKLQYEEAAAADKKRYEEELSRATLVEEPVGEKETTKKTTKPPVYKLPDGQEVKNRRSPYIIFSVATRPALLAELKATDPNVKSTDVMREMGVRWSKLTVEEKKPFVDEAAADKLRYEREVRLAKGEEVEPEAAEAGAEEKKTDEDSSDDKGGDGGKSSKEVGGEDDVPVKAAVGGSEEEDN